MGNDAKNPFWNDTLILAPCLFVVIYSRVTFAVVLFSDSKWDHSFFWAGGCERWHAPIPTQLVVVNLHGGVGQGAKDGDDGDFPDGHFTHGLQVLVPLLDVHGVLLAGGRNQLEEGERRWRCHVRCAEEDHVCMDPRVEEWRHVFPARLQHCCDKNLPWLPNRVTQSVSTQPCSLSGSCSTDFILIISRATSQGS